MPLKTTPFDAADGLTTPEALAAYLIDAASDPEPAIQADALKVVARARARIATHSHLIPNMPGSLK
jgi:DNA-binding phage protein